jgi:hypothetical protein
MGSEKNLLFLFSIKWVSPHGQHVRIFKLVILQFHALVIYIVICSRNPKIVPLTGMLYVEYFHLVRYDLVSID